MNRTWVTGLWDDTAIRKISEKGWAAASETKESSWIKSSKWHVTFAALWDLSRCTSRATWGSAALFKHSAIKKKHCTSAQVSEYLLLFRRVRALTYVSVSLLFNGKVALLSVKQHLNLVWTLCIITKVKKKLCWFFVSYLQQNVTATQKSRNRPGKNYFHSK